MWSVADRNVVIRSITVFPRININRVVVAVETVIVYCEVETESLKYNSGEFRVYTSVVPVSIIPPTLHIFHQLNTILIESKNERSLGTLKNVIIFRREVFFLCFLLLIH